jgi:hypothetical protein
MGAGALWAGGVLEPSRGDYRHRGGTLGIGNAEVVPALHDTVPPVRCSLCGQTLTARWEAGRTVDDVALAVSPHRCLSVTTRVISADALTDEELLDAVKARGLVVR